MARVNITVPDEVLDRARAADLNISAITAAALTEELDRRAKVAALDAYLADLERTHGPLPEDELAAAGAWADALVVSRPKARSGPARSA
ncbi:type II toxin-antitoxin system CcdA family antitoxin [Modestobacter sp. VKM Ac-2983]|uniref:type II toxin-antitoxin system CcdA family antitoxin n=1 Tax=Modestobacter sp. VKM Ac-2983 TaxID=3004137 RepID=UPI0022AB9E51|nr:type II toxin-antitoxin system CcdA family antitoxin [Modestobacter sp. VKM Ac-2983]MCZ2804887.1 type II toxin-antitoxin system CcdA family antitoxin [Modestobacter sp. VKM Ac-2983]